MSCSGSEISVCRWLLDLRCVVYLLANNFCATQRQGVIYGPMEQDSVGEWTAARDSLHVNMPFARWRLSSNALKQLKICDWAGHAACSAAAKCRQAASNECRTPSSFGRIAIHPQDAASGKPLSRKVICAAWEKDVRCWIGEWIGRTAASLECNNPVISNNVLADRIRQDSGEGSFFGLLARKDGSSRLQR
jgi:hypothetical protein